MSEREQVATEKAVFDAIRDKVIDRSIRIRVDNAENHVFPGEILIEASRRLCNDLKEPGAAELDTYRIDRCLEDVVIEGGWGAFYWDQGKRHLRLNPPGWGKP